MLRLGTVFSGIGAVEHALERMGIDFEIEFACDNGEVDIFSEKIEKNLGSINMKFKEFDSMLSNFQNKSSRLENEYSRLVNNANSLRESFSNLLVTEKELSERKRKHEIKEHAERLSMLFESLRVLNVQEELEEIHDYKEKKEFVDNLYKKKEKQNKVKQSYFANYNISEDRFHWNASFLDGHQFRDNIDLFVGGSPCQSFSLVGKQRGLQDTRGTLFYEYGRLIDEIRPKVFIYENVKAVLSNDGGRTWATMQDVFRQLGYRWTYSVLNAKDYGIPQNRERIFVVGIRNDIKLTNEFEFPPKKVELMKTMQDFLLDNVSGKYWISTKTCVI